MNAWGWARAAALVLAACLLGLIIGTLGLLTSLTIF